MREISVRLDPDAAPIGTFDGKVIYDGLSRVAVDHFVDMPLMQVTYASVDWTNSAYYIFVVRSWK